jgi:Zn-finger nucleic acid-binding protein
MEVEPISGAKHLGTTDDNCPVCGARLDQYSIVSMQFEGCPKCHGMWLEKDELRKLKNKIGIGQLHWLNAEVDDLEKTKAGAAPGKRVCPKKDGGQLVSVVFGKSSVALDWCPKCHGIWLDRGEFDKVNEYLTNEVGDASVEDVEKEIAEDFKKLVHGGPESRLAEIGDMAAAVTALVNFSIFDHPTLAKVIMDIQAGGRSIGMD